MSKGKVNNKRVPVRIKASDLFDLWKQAVALRNFAVDGHGFHVVQNEGALKKAASMVTDALKDTNARYGADGDRITGPKAIEYQKARDAIENRMVKVKLFKVPVEALDDIPDITAMAYCVPMLQYDDDDDDTLVEFEPFDEPDSDEVSDDEARKYLKDNPDGP